MAQKENPEIALTLEQCRLQAFWPGGSQRARRRLRFAPPTAAGVFFHEERRNRMVRESTGASVILKALPNSIGRYARERQPDAVAGIGKGLLRLSVGLEAEEDLIAGLEKGLAACVA